MLVLLLASLASAQECVPDCRSGYVCVEGVCVSACNPPCQAGSACTDEGECVATEPVPGPQETADRSAEPTIDAATLKKYARKRLIVGTFEEQQFYSTGGYGGVPVTVSGGTVSGWTVYEGPERLAIMGLARTTGDEALQKDLKRRSQRAWGVAAGLLASGVAVSTIAYWPREYDIMDPQQRRAASVRDAIGLVGIGLISVSFTPPLYHGVKRRYIHRWMSREEAESRVDAHNDVIRGELGLTEEDTRELDGVPAPR